MILSFLVGGLDPTEAEELRRHLAGGCPACAVALAEAQATLAALRLALDPVQPSPMAKARLMQRIDGSASSASPIASDPNRLPDNAVLRLFRILVPAAIAACLAIVVTHAVVMHNMQP